VSSANVFAAGGYVTALFAILVGIFSLVWLLCSENMLLFLEGRVLLAPALKEVAPAVEVGVC